MNTKRGIRTGRGFTPIGSTSLACTLSFKIKFKLLTRFSSWNYDRRSEIPSMFVAGFYRCAVSICCRIYLSGDYDM
jgi:hypothetical protein